MYSPGSIDQIFNTNCLDGLISMPRNSIHLTLTSPPYDGLRSYGGHRFNFDLFREIADQLHRVTTSGGVVVWVVADAIVQGSETGTSARHKLYFKKIGFKIHHTMVMSKAGSRWPSKVRYGDSLEYAFILSKGRPRSINLLRDKPNRLAGEGQGFTRRKLDGRCRPVGAPRPIAPLGCRMAVWNYSPGWGSTTKDRYAYSHPALMPEAMAQDHILSWSRPGDVVFDPMAGAGTTCKMALLSHRHFLGFEIHEPYYRLAQQRLEEAKQQYRRNLDSLLNLA